MHNRSLRPLRKPLLISLIVVIIALVVIWPVINHTNQVAAAQAGAGGPNSPAVPEVLASPLNGGCYIAAPSDCRIHLEPFTINLNPGAKMVKFQLVAARSGGLQTVIYDWRPDISNPAPSSGSVYSPSLVSQDFAAVCGKTYNIYLQGSDTLDGGSSYNMGVTGQFTCPSTVP